MLAFLRKRAQSLVIQAIVVIIALVFIFWGVGTNLMNKQEAAIVVNDEEISFQQFQQAYDQAYSRLAQQFGGTVPKGLAESLNIKQQVINQLIQEALLRQGGQEMGLMVSAREIQKEVEDMVQFQDTNGFSIERYKTILATNRLSPEKYEKSLSYQLLGTKTIDSIAAFSRSTSDFEIEELYNLEKETVSVSYVSVSPERYLAEISVDEEELKQWYLDNDEAYKTQKQVQLTYLPFTFSAIGARITIEDDEITSYYDSHLTDYQIPEKRHARHILFRATPEDSEEIHQNQQQKAAEVLEKARGGEDFATLAQQYSEGPTAETGGDLGFFSRGQMVKEFDDTVFTLQENEISDLVKTDFGYHIIKLEEIQPGGVTSVEQARENIIASLQLEKAKPMALQLANSAYEEIIGAGSLEAYLSKTPDAVVVETDFFTRSAPPPGLSADPAFIDKAFMLKEKELSSLVETADGYVIISANAIKEPQTPELDEVRADVEKDFRAGKAVEQAQSVADQIIIDLNEQAASFEQIAETQGLTLQDSGPLLKNDPNHQSGFPQSLVQDVFRLSASSPVAKQPGLVEQNFYVYRFKERQPPQTAMSDEDRQRYRELLLQFKQQRILDAWISNRQAQADIRIHSSLQNF
ncbi:MAG: SurA N-terminal domain-containing protein [Desulfocapsaceae bacterium]